MKYFQSLNGIMYIETMKMNLLSSKYHCKISIVHQMKISIFNCAIKSC